MRPRKVPIRAAPRVLLNVTPLGRVRGGTAEEAWRDMGAIEEPGLASMSNLHVRYVEGWRRALFEWAGAYQSHRLTGVYGLRIRHFSPYPRRTAISTQTLPRHGSAQQIEWKICRFVSLEAPTSIVSLIHRYTHRPVSERDELPPGQARPVV